jgi:sugar-specific transcriptional regulator TrmB
MTPQLLEELGLNPTQAKLYLLLVQKGSLTPSAAAEAIGQQRTTVYMALQSLQKLGLVEESATGKIKAYQATNPIALEKLSEQRRQEVIDIESKVKQNLPGLLSYYYSFTEKPGIRMVQGVDGLKEIYGDTLRTKQDIHLLRTTADVPNLTQEYLDKYRQKRAQLGITTHALTPDTSIGRQNQQQGVDEAMKFVRTFLPTGSYSAPVEVDVYGNKTAFMIFGDDIMGVIVDSPALAEAMRQIFDLLRLSLSKQAEQLSTDA